MALARSATRRVRRLPRRRPSRRRSSGATMPDMAQDPDATAESTRRSKFREYPARAGSCCLETRDGLAHAAEKTTAHRRLAAGAAVGMGRRRSRPGFVRSSRRSARAPPSRRARRPLPRYGDIAWDRACHAGRRASARLAEEYAEEAGRRARGSRETRQSGQERDIRSAEQVQASAET